MTTWHPVGLALLERRATEVDLMGGKAGTILARIRVTPRRAVVTFAAARNAPALAEAHRLIAAVYDAIDASEGWLHAEPSVRETGVGAVVTVQGVGAATAVASFFGVELEHAARAPRRQQTAMPLEVAS